MQYRIPSNALESLSNAPCGSWKAGPIRGNENRNLRWVEIARLDLRPVTISIGVSDNGYWVRGDGATVELADGGDAITLLPCIEISWRELKAKLSDGLRRLGLAEELSDTFPIDALIATALVSRSQYWTMLALERIEERGVISSVTKALAEAERVAPTQQLRHRARRLLRGS
jgi:hypothetical protein